jgi:hypothetical protein
VRAIWLLFHAIIRGIRRLILLKASFRPVPLPSYAAAAPLLDRPQRLAGHPSEGLNFSFQGECLGGKFPVLQGVPIATGSPASGSMHPACLMPRTAGARHRSPLRFDLVPTLAHARVLLSKFDTGRVGGPGQIGDLGDKFWLDPMNARQHKGRSKARCGRVHTIIAIAMVNTSMEGISGHSNGR